MADFDPTKDAANLSKHGISLARSPIASSSRFATNDTGRSAFGARMQRN